MGSAKGLLQVRTENEARGNSQRRHEKEMKGESRENLKAFFWLLNEER
jgi:hypothetical protein